MHGNGTVSIAATSCLLNHLDHDADQTYQHTLPCQPDSMHMQWMQFVYECVEFTQHGMYGMSLQPPYILHRPTSCVQGCSLL
jgi:hypothetical protein